MFHHAVNRRNPRQGASNTPFKRWLPAQYDDNIALPISWNSDNRYNNFVLPLV